MIRKTKAMKGTVLGVVLAVALAGCGQSTEPGASSEAPELPPIQSMQMDLSFFGNQNKPTAEAELEGIKLNFLNAAVRAAYVNVAVITVLTPPTLAFAAALHTIPSRDGDGYIWIYTWVDRGQDHQIRLRGTPNEDVVDWELYVVLPGEEAELWFRGQSRTDRDEGFWVFSDFTAPGDPEVLRIDWDVDSDTDASLDFLNIHAGNEEEGDALRYRADGSLNSIEFFDASTGTDWDIVWDEADGSGSLRVPDYNNGDRACWDANQDDTVCPAAAGDFLAGDLE